MDTGVYMSPCGLSLFQMVSFKLVSVMILVWNTSHGLVSLNIWSPPDSAVLGSCGLLGVRSYLEEIGLGVGLKVCNPALLAALSLLPGLATWASQLMLLLAWTQFPTTVPSHCDELSNWARVKPSSLLRHRHSCEKRIAQSSSCTIVLSLELGSYIPVCFRVPMRGS